MTGESLNIIQDQLIKLKSIFPEVFAEDKIDWEKLQATLGKENFEIQNERYVLNWAGKTEAFKILQIPTTATLNPQPKESINFDTTQNVFVEGENLEVLKVLQKSYYGKIKCIIIDPPYNTGNDSFIYPDSFKESKADYEKRIGDKDEEGYLMKEGLFRRNSKDSGRFHSNWLSMIYPRLFLAKNLLRDDGVIFVHIDDNEVHNLRLIMNEIFGEENFIAEFIRRQNLAGKQDAKKISIEQDYILAYSVNYDEENINKELAGIKHYRLMDEYEQTRGKFYLRRMDDDGMTYSEKLNFPVLFKAGENVLIFNEKDGLCHKTKIENDIIIYPNNDDKNQSFNWRWSREKIEWGKSKDLIVLKHNKKNQWQICFKSYALVDNNLNAVERRNPYGSLILDFPNNLSHIGMKELFEGKKYFDYPKPIGLIKHLIKIGSKRDTIILDFFAGSGTTAQAVLELNKEDGGNRKFILVQLPELCDENSEAYKAGYKTIADISKERIKRVIEKIKKESEQLKLKDDSTSADLGFKVFKLSSSNFKIWRGSEITEENFAEQLDAYTNPVKEESKTENMLYEIMLKAGYMLTDKVELKGKFYSIKDGELIIALQEMNQKIIDEIIKAHPKKVITLDNLFAGNDQLKTNTVLQMKDAEIDFKTI